MSNKVLNADENCPKCKGKGYLQVDVNNNPYGTGVHQEKRVCECVIKNNK